MELVQATVGAWIRILAEDCPRRKPRWDTGLEAAEDGKGDQIGDPQNSGPSEPKSAPPTPGCTLDLLRQCGRAGPRTGRQQERAKQQPNKCLFSLALALETQTPTVTQYHTLGARNTQSIHELRGTNCDSCPVRFKLNGPQNS